MGSRMSLFNAERKVKVMGLPQRAAQPEQARPGNGAFRSPFDPTKNIFPDQKDFSQVAWTRMWKIRIMITYDHVILPRMYRDWLKGGP